MRSVEWAERVLSEVEAVVGSSGPWNSPSPHAEAFRSISESSTDSAEASFHRVYQNANAAGQIYALSGLLDVGAPGTLTLLDEFSGNRTWVLLWQYDEISCVHAGDFVRGSKTGWPPDIASGAFIAWLRDGPPAP